MQLLFLFEVPVVKVTLMYAVASCGMLSGKTKRSATLDFSGLMKQYQTGWIWYLKRPTGNGTPLSIRTMNFFLLTVVLWRC